MKTRWYLLVLAWLGLFLGSCGEKQYVNVEVAPFAVLVSNDSVQVVDVRTMKEYEEGHIAGAQNVDVLEDGFVEKCEGVLDRKRPVAVYCRSGKRSAKAASLLSGKGYRVTNLLGGYQAWLKARVDSL